MKKELQNLSGIEPVYEVVVTSCIPNMDVISAKISAVVSKYEADKKLPQSYAVISATRLKMMYGSVFEAEVPNAIEIKNLTGATEDHGWQISASLATAAEYPNRVCDVVFRLSIAYYTYEEAQS